MQQVCLEVVPEGAVTGANSSSLYLITTPASTHPDYLPLLPIVSLFTSHCIKAFRFHLFPVGSSCYLPVSPASCPGCEI
ncbi:hypothetical protein AMECASPLE_022755 [Ameca splendens]|uniref:Uncharacterized protein n=1 Tax=Ameca splendens TaxID=208324 RepID=A0ABV0ZCV9_9TELE